MIEGGTQWFRDVLKVRDKYGLDKWSFEIERHGEAGDPKTRYSMLPEEKIDGALRLRVAGAVLHDLATVVSGGGDAEAPRNGDAGAGGTTDAPIGAAAAADLVARMREFSRANVDAILSELGVQRVRDIKAADVPRAMALVAQFERPERTERTVELDPFA